MVLTIGVVLGFRDSVHLSSAYGASAGLVCCTLWPVVCLKGLRFRGCVLSRLCSRDSGRCFAGVAVTMDMLTTTLLVTLVMVIVWRTPLALALLFLLFFGTIEAAFFSSALLKVPHGGW